MSSGRTVVVLSSRATSPPGGAVLAWWCWWLLILVRCAGGDREGTKTRAWEDNGIRSDWRCLGRGAHLYCRSFRLGTSGQIQTREQQKPKRMVRIAPQRTRRDETRRRDRTPPPLVVCDGGSRQRDYGRMRSRLRVSERYVHSDTDGQKETTSGGTNNGAIVPFDLPRQARPPR